MHRIPFRGRKNKIFNIAPAKVVVISFFILIFTGTILLSLPVASRSGASIGLINALFTATSATCVTGLVVVDTYNHWSLFGQIVILFLIQIGGLGLVTLATFFSALLGHKIGLKGVLIARESLNYFSFQGIFKLIKRIVVITFIIETIGAILLSIRFLPLYGLKGLYLSVFHSISAFCNAGFDLMGITGENFSSLTIFKTDPLVLYTVMFLIVAGGLGFIVWKDLYEYIKNKSLLVHTKVVILMTIFLITLGTIVYFLFESGNPETMGSMSLFDKINASLFHSITARTAGFNILSISGMSEISKVVTVFLMFIGAAPGSTAGGIKITTFAVILMAVVSIIKGSDKTLIMGKRIAEDIVNKSLSIIVLGLIIIFSLTTAMLAVHSGTFLDFFYESASAFGTVGLTTGLTPTLGEASKILIIITMFLGRVGPLTFAISLTLRNKKLDEKTVYPDGKIVVG